MHPKLRLPGVSGPGQSAGTDACVCTALRMLSRYASRELDRVLAAHALTLTEFQLMLTLRENGPARTLALAQGLRLAPGPTGRSLARLEERGIVHRPERWRFSTWVLEREGAVHLEVLEPFWHHVDQNLRSELGPAFASAVVRTAERLPPWVPHSGDWLD